MSRQAYQVIAAPEAEFVEPKTFNEAVDRRSRLQADIEALQAELADKNRRDEQGQRLTGEQYADWRAVTIRLLQQKQRELRAVKAWLAAKNGGTKPSEWSLLARAHHLLEQLPVPAQHSAEVESLLDAIEYVVPGRFLDEVTTRAG